MRLLSPALFFPAGNLQRKISVFAFPARNIGVHATKPGMEKNRGEGSRQEGVESRIQSNPRVVKAQQLVNSDSSGGWEKSWEEGATPWDLGQPTPVMVHLHQTGALPKGRALVPGCGSVSFIVY
ncbi:hypothetical protein SLEP1_g6054 [Rubroshorea leprosula]|uniref:Uncharacterized protein n=1 Tax=Rubroshorea leprosula TaxID=152421 RepID=A0AAV5I3L6_9ROSI|nr:hypothetical protein SLEP1_g6054 [Rubroshorea leprosula]